MYYYHAHVVGEKTEAKKKGPLFKVTKIVAAPINLQLID